MTVEDATADDFPNRDDLGCLYVPPDTAAPAPVEVAELSSVNADDVAVIVRALMRAGTAREDNAAAILTSLWSDRTRLAAEKAGAERVIEERGYAFQAAMNEALARAEAAERVIDQAARIMRGEGVEDQGEAWDKALALLDLARAPKDA